MDSARQYLRQRKSILQAVHPQWDYTAAEIDASTDILKRTTEPVCIPPTWDCIKAYVGALNKTADGYDREFHLYGQLKNIGEMGEAVFLAAMRKSNLGGLLIGNIDSWQMLDGHYSTGEHMIPAALGDIVHDVLNDVVPKTKKYGHRFFEIDFVFFHPHIGIFQIEVKTTTNEECCQQLLDKGIKQLSVGTLRFLFLRFCQLLFPNEDANGLWDEFNAGQAIVFPPSGIMAMNDTGNNDKVTERLQRLKAQNEYANVLFPTFDELFAKLALKSDTNRNHFDRAAFKEFAVFLAGYRPDFFISPVRCVLQLYNSIISNDLCSINFYKDGREWSVAGRIELYHASCNDRKLEDDEKLYEQIAVKMKHICHRMINNTTLEKVNRKRRLLNNANCHRIVDQFDKDELVQLCREQFPELVTRKKIKPSNGIHIRPEIKSALNTRHSKSQSGRKYLQQLQERRLIRHSDIVFPDGRSDIFFTQQQLNAIDVFDENGQLCNMRQLIVGPPGSGKSLVLLMKLFILKQVRHHKKLGYGSWWQHHALVVKFVAQNECKIPGCCRTVEFPPREYPDDARGYPVHKFDYDLIFDECWSCLQLERLQADSNCCPDVISITVVTGGSRPSWPRVVDMDGLIEVTQLNTVFRSTILLQRFLAEILGCELVSGHSFFGIPVETRHFADRKSAEAAASARVARLMSSTYLEKGNIGVIKYPMLEDDCDRFEGDVRQFEIIDIPSLEFPIVVAICAANIDKSHLSLIVSRAICHLILFKFDVAV